MTKKGYIFCSLAILSAMILLTSACNRTNAKTTGSDESVATVSNSSETSETSPASVSSDISEEETVAQPDTNESETDIPKGAQILMKCYPDFVKGYKDGKLQMSDGTTLVYDDGRKKSFEQKLDDADAEDMFAFRYDRKVAKPEYLQDAGRSRCEALFKKMYGASQQQVAAKLINVKWFDANGNYGGACVKFTPVNGAADHLKAVADELSKMPQFKKYYKSEGTFYWRQVRGAKRQSAHSYGMTIDIGGNYKTYWLWSNPGAGETAKIRYENKMPMQIVEAFERHGFIWGGRWYHYDTMHFEYRPEILMDNP